MVTIYDFYKEIIYNKNMVIKYVLFKINILS